MYTFVVYVTAVLVYKRFLQEAEAPDTVIFSNESSNTAFTFIHPMSKLCSTGNYCCDFIVTIFAKFLQAVFAVFAFFAVVLQAVSSFYSQLSRSKDRGEKCRMLKDKHRTVCLAVLHTC